jgi:hypothetical protein
MTALAFLIIGGAIFPEFPQTAIAHMALGVIGGYFYSLVIGPISIYFVIIILAVFFLRDALFIISKGWARPYNILRFASLATAVMGILGFLAKLGESPLLFLFIGLAVGSIAAWQTIKAIGRWRAS